MRWLVGLLLLVAALLKAYQLIFEPSALSLSAVDSALFFLQVALEYGLALLVLSGLYWQRLRWVVLVLFIGFATYSLFQAISGAASCGCFGPVRVSPWLTFLIDSCVVVGLLFSVRNKIQNTVDTEIKSSNKNQLLTGAALFLASVITLSTIAFLSQDRTLEDHLPQVGNLVILL